MFILVTGCEEAAIPFWETFSCNTINDLEDLDFDPFLAPDFTRLFLTLIVEDSMTQGPEHIQQDRSKSFVLRES